MVHYFPVRHHSPRTSFVLLAVLERVRPSLILVEGPSDADALIEALVDGETVPPVAILAYRTDGIAQSSLWPFASYSPEYVALKWAHENKVTARFIDHTSGQAMARESEEGEAPSLEEGPSLMDLAARERGFRSFEEFWEASFEAPEYAEEDFRRALLAFAEMVRQDSRNRNEDQGREAIMTSHIQAALAAGTPAEQIVVVVGAAHVAGLLEPGPAAAPPPSVATAITLIPFSFPRLAEQTGYGAGNRAPQFYQRAWDAGVSYRRAALEVLVDFCDHLRLRGFMASLADTIEAYRLACMLANMRGKGEPGLDEVREATVATMCRGESAHIDSFLWSSVVGRDVGKVASRIGRNSLQAEFWREIEARRLPRSDEAQDFILQLSDPLQQETSLFLHRLRVADIPYATYLGSQGVRGSMREEEAGGFGAFSRLRESWEGQWTPATDLHLIEAIVFGETLEQVCERKLGGQLSQCTRTADAAAILMESVLTGATLSTALALAECDRLAASDDDLASLARACRALSGLVAYGTSRTVGSQDILPLCQKTFSRAVLRLSSSCVGNAEAVAEPKEALRILHEIALNQPQVDKAAWLREAHHLTHNYTVNPACSGVACALLHLAREIEDSELALLFQQRLSALGDPEPAASFLSGFLEVNSLVLVKSRPIVAALDSYLVAMEPEQFRDSLPMLRRALSPLGATERRYLVENLLALRNLGAAAAPAKAVLTSDKEQMAAMSSAVAAAMDDLDDLL